MAACRAHPDREATASCTGCGKSLCSECVEAENENGTFCYDCAVSGELERFSEREKLLEKEPVEAGEKPRRFSRVSLVVIAILSLLITAQVVTLLVLRSGGEQVDETGSIPPTRWNLSLPDLSPPEAFPGPPGGETDPAPAEARGRDLCLASMEELRSMLAAYREEHGSFPDSLTQLEAAPGGESAACPVTRTVYTYENRGDDYLLSCPNPDVHGVEVIEATAQSAPAVR